jgi:choline dehydrogenase-like flavoprotein
MDGSLLPTAPGVNPQWTIMAMASLLAERAVR